MTLDAHAIAAGPLTFEERAQVGDEYFQDCFRYAAIATVMLAGVAIAVSFGDAQPGSSILTSVLAAISGLAALGTRSGGYQLLRRHPYALAAAGPLIAVVCLLHAVDANALYFPTLAPLAFAPCVAQNRRQQYVVIASLTFGTLLAALEDTRLPRLQQPGELASSTVAVLVIGILLVLIIDWWARKVLLAPDPQPAPLAPVTRDQDPVPVAALVSQPDVPRIAAAEPADFLALEIPGMEKLTGRQLQLLYLIRAGLSQQDAAVQLFISIKTVRRQVERIRLRLELVDTGTATATVASPLPELPAGFPDQQ